METEINKSAKRVISAVVAVALLVGTLFTANVGVQITADATEPATTTTAVYWSGDKADMPAYESGSGTKADPYIIATAEQLWTMVNDSNSYITKEEKTIKNYSSDNTYTEKSATKYYGAKYYKIADGITDIYLNYKEDEDGTKSFFTSMDEFENHCTTAGNEKLKWWTHSSSDAGRNTQVIFCGNFDGNGATIHGMRTNTSFFYELDGDSCVISNINFDFTYAAGWRPAVLTSSLGDRCDYYYKNDTAAGTGVQSAYLHNNYVNISNVNVTNAIVLADNTSKLDGNPAAGGLLASTKIPEMLTISNCYFDGESSTIDYSAESTETANGIGSAPFAGIAAVPTYVGGITINGCVSTVYPLVPMMTDSSFKKTYNYVAGKRFNINNCFSPIPDGFDTETYTVVADGVTDIKDASVSYITPKKAPLLDWSNGWQLVDGKLSVKPNANEITGVKFTYEMYKQLENSSATAGDGVQSQYGKYGWNHLFTGSGTKEDPYMITNALDLARAIGSGGKNLGTKLYYKLACDIDLGGSTWLKANDSYSYTDSSNNTLYDYIYVPFEGTLDGDGYAITGLYTSDAEQTTGLIPVLNGGSVLNLHIRDSYVASGNATGFIVGKANSGTIDGCSVEYSSTYSGTQLNAFVGIGTATVKNSYSVIGDTTKYFDANGSANTPTADIYNGKNLDTAKWYKGNNDTYRLLSFARTRQYADVKGDGKIDDYYDANDLVALRSQILGVSGYENVYGDVNNDGRINIADIVVMRRAMVQDDIVIQDGFWRNAAIGKTAIYYAENDTYDMARRMELYLEGLYPSLDIAKVPGKDVTAKNISESEKANYNGESNAIVIKQEANPTDSNYGDYSISYDKAKNVLTIYGGSFTAVEYAVNAFIKNSDPTTDAVDVYTASGSILTDDNHLASKTVEGTTYYYAWGDEFDGSEYSVDNWSYLGYKSEDNDNTTTVSGRYQGLENATVDSVSSLWAVSAGKLSIKRGYNSNLVTGSSATNAKNAGYVPVDLGATGNKHSDFYNRTVDRDDYYVDAGQMVTSKSMLFKQGYAEMRASLPTDGHAFPAWWFLTGTEGKLNRHFQRTLYNKVYKLNNSENNPNTPWDGSTSELNPDDLTTYKYQIPQAYLEFDIIEFMQIAADGSGSYGRADYINHTNFTIHKIYNANVFSDYLFVPDWTAGTTKRINSTQFNSTSSGSFIHYYNKSVASAPYKKTGDPSTFTFASTPYSSTKSLSDENTYGFAWTVDEVNKKYSLKIYLDFDEDGAMENNEVIYSIDQSVGHDRTDYIWNEGLKAECAVWNQYAFMLLDNAYYTSDGSTQFVQKNMFGNSSTSFDIDYVRVYQQDGRRDIVTQETEAFNTANHFGY